MTTKIIALISGGLGNQLFTYAAARRLALTNNAELVLDDVSGFSYDHDYQRHHQLDHFNVPCRKATAAERLEPFSRVRRGLKRRWNQNLPFEQRTYVVQERRNDWDARLVNLVVRRGAVIYFEGCWQSEGYFKDVEDTIRQDLSIIPPIDAANLDMAKKIRACSSVAVHVRFFDAPETFGVHNVSRDYYTRAVETMDRFVPGAQYFIFSDIPKAARAVIPLQNRRVTVVANNRGDANVYADLWLMTQCQHFIIANSTFSWWGAWLSGYGGKHVIAPGFKIGGTQRITSWGFKGLLPSDWVLINI